MAGLMACGTKIHNQSSETIYLIPFSCLNGVDPRSVFKVETHLAIKIPAGKSEPVKPERYSSRGVDSGSQIYMLFRAEDCQSVQVLEEDKLFLHTDLARRTEWYLSLSPDGRRQVIGGPGYAVVQAALGANAAGPQDARLRGLMEEVRQLTERVEALARQLTQKVEDLKTALA